MVSLVHGAAWCMVHGTLRDAPILTELPLGFNKRKQTTKFHSTLCLFARSMVMVHGAWCMVHGACPPISVCKLIDGSWCTPGTGVRMLPTLGTKCFAVFGTCVFGREASATGAGELRALCLNWKRRLEGARSLVPRTHSVDSCVAVYALVCAFDMHARKDAARARQPALQVGGQEDSSLT